MYERFTSHARKVMQLANEEARRFNHEYIGTEHILLGLVKEGSGVAANVLKNLDIDLGKVRLEVEMISRALEATNCNRARAAERLGIRRQLLYDKMARYGLSGPDNRAGTAGADGLLIEIHPDPDHAMSDGAQSLTFAAFEKLLESLKRLAEPLGRRIN